MSDAFTLHPALATDTLAVASLPVSELLLMNDARFPWCILVPRFPALTELHHVPAAARLPLFEEVDRLSRCLLTLPAVTKINVGALGNRVPQLHVHVVGRHPADAAWPGPVWGAGTAEAYTTAAAGRMLEVIRSGIR
jgi:diadenosine tetraphosphate (Ap4A) HIT family hydrolase